MVDWNNRSAFYLLGYLYARETERTAIRTILSGKAAGLSTDTIRERLREAYV